MYNPYCLTYFLVKHNNENFDIDDFARSLSLDVEVLKYYGTDTTIEIGRNEFFDYDINAMVRISIKELLGKEETLLHLKNKYDLEYYIERVPLLFNGDDVPKQRLSLDSDIIEFMFKIGAKDDLDYFVVDTD